MTTVNTAEENVPQIERGRRNKETFDYVAALFRQGKHTQAEIEELAQEFNQERCAEPAPEKKITSMVSRVSKSNKPKKQDTYRLWYFPNLAKEDLQNMSYLELTNLQRGWRAVLEKQAWLNRGVLPADKNKLLMLALIHSPDEREQFIKEDLQLILYDFELVIPEESPAYWFNAYMHDECKRIQKTIRTKVIAGQLSAAAKKKKLLEAQQFENGIEVEAQI
jgi:hypothetical protein